MNKHTSDIDPAFDHVFLSACIRIDCKPIDLLGVMFSESGCRAGAHNANGHASGLIQFMPPILKGLGWSAGHEAFRTLSASAQLPYVIAYYAPWKKDAGAWYSAGRLYQATFLPATLKTVREPQDVLAERSGRLGWAYEANAVFDADKNLKITLDELTQAVQRNARGARWLEMLKRLGLEAPAHELRDVDGDGAVDVITQLDVQVALNRLMNDLPPLAEDGIAGPMTRARVRAFQGRTGIGVDGIAGPVTRRTLAECLARAT